MVALAEDAVRPSAFEPIQEALERGDMFAAVRLPRFGSLLSHRTQPGITFAQEFRERLRVIACLTSAVFMAHSDEPDAVTQENWDRVRTLFETKPAGDDTYIVVWGAEEDVATACRELVIRARDATIGVPSETRQAHDDGTTGLERILPGPERMYPDTDTPRVTIPDAWVDALQVEETPWVRQERYVAAGLATDVARRLASSEWAPVFDAAAPASSAAATRLAHALEKRIPHLRRAGRLDGLPDAARIAVLVKDVEDGAIGADAFEAAFDDVVTDVDRDIELVLAAFRAGADDEELLDERLDVVRKLVRRPGQDDDTFERRALGEVMPYLLGRMSHDAVRAALANLAGDAS
jgi:glutamyl-tRNA(Gln) amidotransferase subunit E